MYKLEDLNTKKVVDLQKIAKDLDIKKFEKLNKLDLAYAILDHQAENSKPKIRNQKTTINSRKKTSSKKTELKNKNEQNKKSEQNKNNKTEEITQNKEQEREKKLL